MVSNTSSSLDISLGTNCMTGLFSFLLLSSFREALCSLSQVSAASSSSMSTTLISSDTRRFLLSENTEGEYLEPLVLIIIE